MQSLNPPTIDHRSFDGDGDGLPDSWEEIFGFDNTSDDASQDGDSDGLSNLQELTLRQTRLCRIRMEMVFRMGMKFRPIPSPLELDTDEDGFSVSKRLRMEQTL